MGDIGSWIIDGGKWSLPYKAAIFHDYSQGLNPGVSPITKLWSLSNPYLFLVYDADPVSAPGWLYLCSRLSLQQRLQTEMNDQYSEDLEAALSTSNCNLSFDLSKP